MKEPLSDLTDRLIAEMAAKARLRMAQRPPRQPNDKPAEKPAKASPSSDLEAELSAALGITTEKPAAENAPALSLEDMLKAELNK